LFPRIRTVIADAGHQSRKLARTLKQDQGWQLRIVKRRQRAFKITGLTWIVERSFAWLGRNRRLSKDYEYRVQTSETMIDLASIRLMLNRIALRETFQTPSYLTYLKRLNVGSRNLPLSSHHLQLKAAQVVRSSSTIRTIDFLVSSSLSWSSFSRSPNLIGVSNKEPMCMR
jgi:Transposase DDE domain